jgi:hypothetical protein
VGETRRDAVGRAGTQLLGWSWDRSTAAGVESIGVVWQMQAEGRSELRPQR